MSKKAAVKMLDREADGLARSNMSGDARQIASAILAGARAIVMALPEQPDVEKLIAEIQARIDAKDAMIAAMVNPCCSPVTFSHCPTTCYSSTLKPEPQREIEAAEVIGRAIRLIEQLGRPGQVEVMRELDLRFRPEKKT